MDCPWALLDTYSDFSIQGGTIGRDLQLVPRLPSAGGMRVREHSLFRLPPGVSARRRPQLLVGSGANFGSGASARLHWPGLGDMDEDIYMRIRMYIWSTASSACKGLGLGLGHIHAEHCLQRTECALGGC